MLDVSSEMKFLSADNHRILSIFIAFDRLIVPLTSFDMSQPAVFVPSSPTLARAISSSTSPVHFRAPSPLSPRPSALSILKPCRECSRELLRPDLCSDTMCHPLISFRAMSSMPIIFSQPSLTGNTVHQLHRPSHPGRLGPVSVPS